VVAEDQDLKCLRPGLCVGDKAPEALDHLGLWDGMLQAVICQPESPNPPPPPSVGALLAGRTCSSGDYDILLVQPAYVGRDKRPREAVHTEIDVRNGMIDHIHRGPPPITL
jgi:hypothetical protein